MSQIRLLAAFFLLHLTLPSAGAALDRESLAGLPTIVVDGVLCTLPDAVRAATTGTTFGGCTGFPGLEVIQLDVDVVLTEANFLASDVGGAQASVPDITSAVIIAAGNGSVIERDAALPCGPNEPTAFRLFNILDTGSLFLFDITLRGGCVAPASGLVAQGGAIHLNGGSLELSNIVLENHQVRGLESGNSGTLGGALYCFEGTVSSISASTFRSNASLGTDGQATGTEAEGGAGYFEQCQLTRLENTLFESNTAIGSSDQNDDAEGGALSIVDSSLGIIQQNGFFDNVAQGGSDTTGGTASPGSGGAMRVERGTIDFFGSNTFVRNQARSGNSTSSSGNTADGGAIEFAGVAGSSSTIVQSHFEDNLAQGGNSGGTSSPGNSSGGAIHLSSSFHLSGIEDSLFRGNQSLSGELVGPGGGTRASGGAVSVSSAASIGDIDRVTFESNLAKGGAASSVSALGGALFVDGTVSRLRNSTFVGNRALGGTDNDPADPGGNGQGGALRISGTIATIHANTFVDNEAQGGFGAAGSGLGLGGAIHNNAGTPMDVSGNLMTGNRTLDVDGIATFEDCRDDGPGIVSGGWNRVQAAGNCGFAATGDVTGAATATYPPADWGCFSSLPDGTCVPTVAIDETSAAIDQGSCTSLLLGVDSRLTLRPFDLPTVGDADDGCDIGAFEATDPDGDGFTEATDCAPDDPMMHTVDHCGVCGGDGTSCPLFEDGFESGDTSMWSSQHPI